MSPTQKRVKQWVLRREQRVERVDDPVMNLQTKILGGGDGDNYLIMVALGPLTQRSLKQILQKLSAAMNTQGARKILVDFQDVTMMLGSRLDFDKILADWELAPNDCRVVFVCPLKSAHYCSLIALRTRLCARGLRVAVFSNSKLAADWLAL